MHLLLRTFLTLIFLVSLTAVQAQSLNGTLFLHYGKSGTPGYTTLEAFDFPSKQVQELRRGIVHDMLLDGDTLWLAVEDSLLAFDANTKQQLIAVQAAGIRHISLSDNGIAAGFSQPPYLRIHNRVTGVEQSYFPQSVLDQAPIDVEAHSIFAFVLAADTVFPFDLDFMQPSVPVPTPELYAGLGYNTYLLKNADSLFIVTSYATGAPRHSVFTLDPFTRMVDTLYHKEFFDFFGIPFYGDGKIISNHYLNYYDIATDSFYMYPTFEPLYSVAYDEVSDNLFYIDLMSSNLIVGPIPQGFTATLSLGTYQHVTSERGLFYPTTSTGIQEEPSEPMLQIAPNPTVDWAQIQWEDNTPVDIFVTNLIGQQMISPKRIISSYKLDTRAWPVGLYLVHWETDKAHGTSKLIKH